MTRSPSAPKRGRWRLSRLLAILFVLVAFLPVVLATVFLMAWLPAWAEKQLRSQQIEQAVSVARQIEQRLQNAAQTISNASEAIQSGPSPHDADGLTTLLDAYVGINQYFETIYLTDATGHGRIEALGMPKAMRHTREDYIGIDMRSYGFIERAQRSGRIVWSDTYLSPVSGRQAVSVASPVGKQTLIGELAIELLIPQANTIAINPNLVSMIFDGRGQLIGHPSRELATQQMNFSNLPLIQDALSGRRVTGHFHIQGQTYSASAVAIESLGWVSLIALPEEDTHGLLHSVLKSLATVLIISSVLAAIAGLLLSRAGLKYFQRFELYAKKIADGEEPQWNPSPILEFNELSVQFHHMYDEVGKREKALLHSESQYRNLVDTSSALIMRIDQRGQILFINPVSRQFFGVAPEHCLGKNWTLYLHPDDSASLTGMFHRWIQIEYGQAAWESRVVNREGETRTLAWTIHPRALETSPGNAASSSAEVELLMIGYDITRRRQAEQQLKESEQKFSAIFDASPLPIAVTNLDTNRIVNANLALSRTFGRTRDQIVGTHPLDIGLWKDPADRARLVEQIQTQGLVTNYFATLMHAAGWEISCEFCGTTFELGGDRYMILVIQDITERRRMEDELRNMNVVLDDRVRQRTLELEAANVEIQRNFDALVHAQHELVESEKLAALGGLVAGVAHEINTPIGNSLMIATSLQEQTLTLQQKAQSGMKRSDFDQWVADIHSAANVLTRNLHKAAELVSSFKQVAVDRTSSQRRDFNIHEVIGEVLVTLRPTVKQKPYRFEADVPDDISLDSYPGPLGQVLTNLVQNAVNHAFEGRDHGKVVIKVQRLNQDNIEIVVNDDGWGIPPQNISRIFEPFFTTKMGQGGSGLGLSIVYSIVNQVLGGNISVTSELGEGSCFRLEIPIHAPRQ